MYIPSIGTNLRATFAEVRKKLVAEQGQREERSPGFSGHAARVCGEDGPRDTGQ